MRMSDTLVRLKAEAGQLTRQVRADLAYSLLQDLEGIEDDGVEAAWIEELKRRDVDLASGVKSCIPAEEVFAKLRRKHLR
jgi:hypothetical protein